MLKLLIGTVHILRPGSITLEQIKTITDNVVLENSALPSKDLKHYTLDINSILIYRKDRQEMSKKITSIAKNYKNPLVLCFAENINNYNFQTLILGSYNHLDDVAKNLFSNLKKAETCKPDILLVEGIKQESLGIAIMDRLINCCNEKDIKF